MAHPALASGSISDRLATLHRELRYDHPAIDRIAIALFDRDLGRLRTFAHSTVGDTPLARYEMALASQLPAAVEVRTHFAECAPATNSHEGYAADL